MLLAAVCWLPIDGQTDAAEKRRNDSLLRILNDSPWAKTQTETDTSELFFSPTSRGSSLPLGGQTNSNNVREQQQRNNSRSERGAFNQAISVNYRIRFFSARPVREAMANLFAIQNPAANPALLREWESFVDRDFGQYIVVTVSYDAEDGRLLGPAIQGFAGATKDTLRNGTYLERNDGKRVFLLDYRPPSDEGIGARFVFPRMLDGKPFLTVNNNHVRFVSDVAPAIKLNMKFSVAEMVYQDRLSY